MRLRFDLGRAVRCADGLGRWFVAACVLSLALAGPVRAAEAVCAAPRFLDQVQLASLSGHVTRHEAVRVLAIGSSSTEGIGASSPAAAYPQQLEEDLSTAWRGTPVRVANAGIGGETASQTLARLERALTGPEKPDLVLWQVGTNDAITGGDEAAFRAMVERGIALVRAAGIDLVLIDQQYFPGIPDHARYERFVGIVAAVAMQARVPVFSRYALMKDWNSQDPALLLSMLSGDRFHMSDRGYDCLAEALSRGIVRASLPAAQTVARAKRPAVSDALPTRKG
ncbi:SGNH/GDSL hydrolase family protein [Methylobacterium sp. ID0610]|uniref:SGNH/GDSL hydrolase family protein n=1 Tax=Methylobacterium carpenticola TaxID=3344827 RepID=UPI00367ECE77